MFSATGEKVLPDKIGHHGDLWLLLKILFFRNMCQMFYIGREKSLGQIREWNRNGSRFPFLSKNTV